MRRSRWLSLVQDKMEIERILHACAWILILSSSVQLDISRVEDKIRIHKRISNIVFFLHKHTNDDVFDDFPKISEDFFKGFRRPDERSRTFSENVRRLPKISEDYRRLPRKN